jgi:hypothetical protein
MAARTRRNRLSAGCTRATPRYSPPQTPVSANTRATTKYVITMQANVRPIHRAASATLRGERTLISDRSRMVSPLPTCHAAPCPDLPRPEGESNHNSESCQREFRIRDTDLLVPNSDVLTEHAYLVARGVRPPAIAGHFATIEASALRIATLLERGAADEPVIPFVLDHRDGSGSFGFADSRWTLDFYEWSVTDPAIRRPAVDRRAT